MHEESRTPDTRAPGSDRLPAAWRVVLVLLVAVLAALPFLGALDGEFLDWDDRQALVENDSYRGFDARSVRWWFSSYHMGHYMPLSWMSLALDHAVWGLEPFGFHLTNVVLHALNALLVMLLALRLQQRRGRGNARSRWAIAALSALLFAMHPLRVESVAWITERRDVLSCLFLLLTVLAYERATLPGARRARWLALGLVLFALSLFSKAWGITLPALLLVLDLWVLDRRRGPSPAPWSRLLLEKLLFVPFALAAAWLAASAQSHAEAVVDLGRHGITARAAQAAYGLAFYPLRSLWPSDLSPLYALTRDVHLGRPLFALCFAAVLLLTGLLAGLRRRAPAALAAWLCFAIAVSPVLGLLQSGVQLVADRYSYIACIPLTLWLAAAAVRVFEGSRARNAVGAALAALVLAALGGATHAQTAVWRDSHSVWARVTEIEPESYIGNWMLGVNLHERGEFEQAIAHYRTAMRVNEAARTDEGTRDVGLRFRVALAQIDLGRLRAAESTLAGVLELRPDHLPALQALRSLLEADGRTQAAEGLLQQAARRAPDAVEVRLELSDFLLDTNRFEDALSVAEQLARTHPDDASVAARVGLTLLYLGRFALAERSLRRALELAPEHVTARNNLAVSLEKRGLYAEAREVWSEALELDPENSTARRKLADYGPEPEVPGRP